MNTNWKMSKMLLERLESTTSENHLQTMSEHPITGKCEKLFHNLPLQQDEKCNNIIAEKQNTTDTKSVKTNEILVTPFQYLSRSLANVLINAPTESTTECITKKIDFNDAGLGDPNYFVNIYSSNTSRAETTNNTGNFKRPYDIDSSVFGPNKRKIYQNRRLKDFSPSFWPIPKFDINQFKGSASYNIDVSKVDTNVPPLIIVIPTTDSDISTDAILKNGNRSQHNFKESPPFNQNITPNYLQYTNTDSNIVKDKNYIDSGILPNRCNSVPSKRNTSSIVREQHSARITSLSAHTTLSMDISPLDLISVNYSEQTENLSTTICENNIQKPNIDIVTTSNNTTLKPETTITYQKLGKLKTGLESLDTSITQYNNNRPLQTTYLDHIKQFSGQISRNNQQSKTVDMDNIMSKPIKIAKMSDKELYPKYRKLKSGRISYETSSTSSIISSSSTCSEKTGKLLETSSGYHKQATNTPETPPNILPESPGKFSVNKKSGIPPNTRSRKLKMQQTLSASNEVQKNQSDTIHVPTSFTNNIQLFLNIRKQIADKRKNLFPVQPKPPSGFQDYLMNKRTYLLANRKNSMLLNMLKSPPTHLNEKLRQMFIHQEEERQKLRGQHIAEKEKLVLSVEQEILRVHGRAARELANQKLPFSACTILIDDEVYNLKTPEQEKAEKKRLQSCYNGDIFLSWLQEVDDKWEKIKESMILRHHNEAESLHAVQKMDWGLKMIQLKLCSKLDLKPEHVSIVHVSDDFIIYPETIPSDCSTSK